jgi:hypothetical protein
MKEMSHILCILMWRMKKCPTYFVFRGGGCKKCPTYFVFEG